MGHAGHLTAIVVLLQVCTTARLVHSSEKCLAQSEVNLRQKHNERCIGGGTYYDWLPDQACVDIEVTTETSRRPHSNEAHLISVHRTRYLTCVSH